MSPPHDPGNRYCAPYLWGTLGIGYNRPAVGRDIAGWTDFFNPAFAGRVSLLADPRYTMGVVLIHLGFSPNTTSKVEIAKARDFLIARAQHIAEYAPDTGQDLLADGKVDMAYEWSGDIFQLMKTNPDVRYVIPREGTITWIDSLCILADAPNKKWAERFINFILDAENGAILADHVHDPSPNRAAIALLKPEDREDPATYPSEDIRKRLFLLNDVGPEVTQFYQDAWAQVQAARER